MRAADIDAYLARIGYAGELNANLATLRALHRAHLLAVPYENLDVQLGRPLTTDPAAAFDKIVRRRRGGWCYEMNGAFGLVLEALGFPVTRLAGAVLRELLGADNLASHLVLKVDLEETWLADVGYGDGPIEPFEPVPGGYEQRGFEFGRELTDDGWLRMRNHRFAPRSFDVRLEPADEVALAGKCDQLQTAPTSVFVNNAIVQRHTEDGLVLLRNRTLRRITPQGAEERLVDSPEDYVALLADPFGLDLPEAAPLWPRICAQHEASLIPAG
ncbi:MAG: arylamine N-acetyltransferase [Phenylobacterium sp.]|jgi:N-hydroxyarylamine O-acetyltransferase|uniref:arylamine N-acetyltransferase family protein n=1 Tax=Phenylobacterium sp. TaxID=1871053 RepID=UPI002A272EE4|nr:arylamine N-acetyltransferase [Phenylobacterium sp.]MDD3836962.1 arylamine N-acetyltransferase [Phenylobacterium sp.]MDX9999358.1 arylamine N-acetyltransferase [Phenylobacterium sp.]